MNKQTNKQQISILDLMTQNTPVPKLPTPTRAPNQFPHEEIDSEECGEEYNPDLKTEKFRLNTVRLLLTYKTHIDKVAFISFLKREFKCPEADVWVAHESADKNHPYLHSHCLIDFKNRINRTGSRCLDFGGIHPHFKRVMTKLHWERSMRYLCKEDQTNLDLIERIKALQQDVTTSVWSCNNVHDALRKNCKSVNQASGIIALYDLKPLDKPNNILPPYDPNLYEYRQVIEKIINSPPDGRTIYWFWEPTGNMGKTRTTYYLEDVHNAYIIRKPGSAADFAQLMYGAVVKDGWRGTTVCVDFPREANRRLIWESLEGITDGRMNTTKYQGKSFRFAPCRVIVFANYEPPDPHLVSADRLVEVPIGGTQETVRAKALLREAFDWAFTDPVQSQRILLEYNKIQKNP